MKIIHLSEFEHDVLNSSVPVLIDFGAAWCQPCKQLEPILEELCNGWGETTIKLVQIKAEDDPDLINELQIFSLPTVLVFLNGKEVLRLSGLQSRQRLIEKVTPFLNKT